MILWPLRQKYNRLSNEVLGFYGLKVALYYLGRKKYMCRRVVIMVQVVLLGVFMRVAVL
jgi:DNA-directed RNA polymerase subunit N (RpoN/RPB10)